MNTGRLSCMPSMAIVDVGHGSSAVLHDGELVAVMDAGPKPYLLQYLEDMGVDVVDMVIISHADNDHIGGLIALLSSEICRVRNVVVNADSQKTSRIWGDLRSIVDSKVAEGSMQLHLGTHTGPINGWHGKSCQLEAVAPSVHMAMGGPGARSRGNRRITSNSSSIVVRVLFEGKPAVLLAADMDGVTLEDIISKDQQCDAPILVFPHHGGRAGGDDCESFTRNLLDRVKPRQVIFSNGRGIHGTPRPEIVQAIRSNGADVKIACTQLSQNCAEKSPAASSSHLSGLFARGAKVGHCCAGTVEIDLARQAIVSRQLDAHQEFVIKLPTALCQTPSAALAQP